VVGRRLPVVRRARDEDQLPGLALEETDVPFDLLRLESDEVDDRVELAGAERRLERRLVGDVRRERRDSGDRLVGARSPVEVVEFDAALHGQERGVVGQVPGSADE